MNFENVSKSVMLTIAAGKVPVIVGERGIGKSQMIKDIALRLDMKAITIDCNLLKEGEITGLPIPTRNPEGIMVTEYALHSKLKVVEDYLRDNEDGSVLLFLDELNRTTKETMSELMNLILNRELQGYTLPDNVFIVAAINPTSTTKGFEGNASYGVTEMDAASKNRLVWLYLDMDPKSWLSWAINKPKEELKESEKVELTMFDKFAYPTVIDERIIEFIANMPNLLNIPNENTDVSPSARTWEFCSDIMRTYEINKSVFEPSHLDACIKGCVGDEAFIQFMQFMNNNKNPLIKPEQFWEGKELNEELVSKFENDTLPRQIIMSKNIARFISEKKRLMASDIEKLSTLYSKLPIDILIIIMRHIKEEYATLHNKLLDNDNYLTLYSNALKIANR